MAEGGLLDQSREPAATSRTRRSRPRGAQAPDRPPRRGRRDRLGDRLPLLRARLLRRRRRLERRRRHRPGDHLSDAATPAPSSRHACSTRRRPTALDAHGSKDAAVLVADLRLARRARASSSPSAATTCAATPARSRSPAAAPTRARRWSSAPCARPRRRSASTRPRSTSSARSRRPRPSSPPTGCCPSSG